MYQLNGLHWSLPLRASRSDILEEERGRRGGGGEGEQRTIVADSLAIFHFIRERVSLIEERLVLIQPHFNCSSYVSVHTDTNQAS